MLAIPSALQSKFEEHLRNKAIPDNLHGMYQKWLRYYLDFCRKYHLPPKHEKSLPPFIKKLQDKQQSQAQQEQWEGEVRAECVWKNRFLSHPPLDRPKVYVSPLRNSALNALSRTDRGMKAHKEFNLDQVLF